MRLELTLCKEVIRNKFNIDDKYNNSRSRLNRHTLVLSDELLDIYEKDAKEHKYQIQFESWYFSLIGSAKRLKRVNLSEAKVEEKKEKQEETQEEREEGFIIADTAANTKDKIVVGEIEKRISKHYKNAYFIKEEIFNRDKSHTVNIGDIKDVWDKAVLEHIFDIYETPIRIETSMGDDAILLGKYLSLFYKDSKNVTIKDTYMHKNENNLDKFVLKYIDKKSTKITFRAFWNYKIKEELINRYTNYKGYNSKVIIENKKLSHHSMIESDEYIIDLGYRLRVFGDKEDNKTEQEVINITRK
jgi:hypothetical protein